MPAAFFTPVKHFHYSYFFTNFGITRVKIWRKWTYILVIDWHGYFSSMTHDSLFQCSKKIRNNLQMMIYKNGFRTRQNCQCESDVSIWLNLHNCAQYTSCPDAVQKRMFVIWICVETGKICQRYQQSVFCELHKIKGWLNIRFSLDKFLQFKID